MATRPRAVPSPSWPGAGPRAAAAAAAPAHPTPARDGGGHAAAEVTCKGVGVDGLQSLQLVALLLAVVCHRGPRRCPWIAQTPRRRAAAGTTAAPVERAAAGGRRRRVPGWEARSPEPPGGPAERQPRAGLRPLPSSAFDSSGLAGGGAERPALCHARSGFAREGLGHPRVWHSSRTPRAGSGAVRGLSPRSPLRAASALDESGLKGGLRFRSRSEARGGGSGREWATSAVSGSSACDPAGRWGAAARPGSAC